MEGYTEQEMEIIRKEENEYRMWQEDPEKFIFMTMMKKIRRGNTACWEAADGFRFLREIRESRRE